MQIQLRTNLLNSVNIENLQSLLKLLVETKDEEQGRIVEEALPKIGFTFLIAINSI